MPGSVDQGKVDKELSSFWNQGFIAMNSMFREPPLRQIWRGVAY